MAPDTSLTEFRRRVATELATTPEELPLELPLDDLGFDSLARVELLAMMDDIGLSVSAETMLGRITLRGLYEAATHTEVERHAV
jgi:acyl carrier protein